MGVRKMKERIKAKMAAHKQKVKDKLKGKGVKKAKLALITLAVLPLCGCPSANPASRATASDVGDLTVKICVERKAYGNTINVNYSLSDMALESADSSGSTETQTATPTVDVRTRVDARYNDAIAGATSASRKVLGTIGDGLDAVLELMLNKQSGKVRVTKTDGTAAVVQCDGGQCSYCPDCTE